MVVDFALLVGGWGAGSASEDEDRRGKVLAVVCGLSSDVCKMAAVAMGWERGVGQGRWVNVDGGEDFDWRPTEIM